MKTLTALLLLLTSAAFGQFPQRVRFVSADPSGACGAAYITQNTTTGALYGCVSSVWTAIGGGGGSISPGTTIAIPQWAEVFAGVCQGSTASLGWDLAATNTPTPACKTGTNTQVGVAQFTASGQTVQGSFVLPDDWTSVLAVEFRFLSESAASTGNVLWDFGYACVANTAASIDPSFAANQTATVAAGANNLTNIATLATPTISGCSAGQRMFYKIGLDASTTAAGNQDIVSIRFKLKRTVTAL